MKLWKNEEIMSRIVANTVVICLGILLCFFLFNLPKIQTNFGFFLSLITPFIYGFVIAYLLSGPVKFFERKCLGFLDKGKARPHLKRMTAILIAMVLSFVVLGALLAVLVPQLMDSVIMLVNNIQRYISNVEVWAQDILTNPNFQMDQQVYDRLYLSWEQFLDKASTILVVGVQSLLGLTGQITAGILNVFIAIIIAIYLLTSKERFFAQLKKIQYAFLPKSLVEHLVGVGQLTNRTFNGFINGKIIDSVIIGILAFICLSLMKMPYTLLISVIIGVTNIIPFFGPFIGAIPSVFIIFIVDPLKAFWFLIFIFLLQQFDGNILGPKILGNTTGLPAIWVLFAILVGGGLAGFVGMLIGVPTFAVIYTLLKGYLEYRLTLRGMSKETRDYASEENPIEF